MPPDPDEAIALFRFKTIAEAIDAPPAERGRIVRALSALTHVGPDGSGRTFSRGTLDRWIRAYKARGLAGLVPRTRSDSGGVRRHAELFEEAAALRIELPSRSAALIADILWHRHGVKVPERTMRAQLQKRGLTRKALAAEPRVFGRYEAAHPNDRWITDVLVGPFVPHPRVAGSRRARLFLIVDDHSRLLVYGRWVRDENTRAGQVVLRHAIARRGVPRQLYADNGAPFANAQLERSCAVLGIHLVHSKPYSPAGRGKQERLNRYIRERFVAEACHAGIKDFDELNDRFMAWAESVANTRVHAETGEKPIERFLAAGPPEAADPAAVADAFRWSAMRAVTKTATVSVTGNRYQVDPALVGRRVELRYDPEDMSTLGVYVDGRPAGAAAPLVIGQHVHPAVPQARHPDPSPTGIDYLGLVLEAHDDGGAEAIAYRELLAEAYGTDDEGGAER